jgi:RimJ/RimL family protein N-acetyltransferase
MRRILILGMMTFVIAGSTELATAQLAIKSENSILSLLNYRGARGDGLEIRMARWNEPWARVDQILLDPETSRFWSMRPILKENLETYRLELKFGPWKREFEGVERGFVKLLIVDTSTQEVVGLVNVMELGYPNPKFDLGYVIHPQERGRGLATRAVNLLAASLKYLAPAKPITALVFPDNELSKKVLKKAGFVLDDYPVWDGVRFCEYLLAN